MVQSKSQVAESTYFKIIDKPQLGSYHGGDPRHSTADETDFTHSEQYFLSARGGGAGERTARNINTTSGLMDYSRGEITPTSAKSLKSLQPKNLQFKQNPVGRTTTSAFPGELPLRHATTIHEDVRESHPQTSSGSAGCSADEGPASGCLDRV